MTGSTKRSLLALLIFIGLIAAACGDSSEPAATTAAAPATTAAAPATTEAPAESMYNLAGHCPDVVSIQTDWFPEAEHGAMYEMVGDDYTIDGEAQITSGSLVIGGEDTGVDIEVRAGGPAIGFAPVRSYMYANPGDIDFGYGTTDALVLGYEDAPMLAVAAPLEKNPQIIMWDPETYPDVETIADLRDADVLVQVFAGGSFSEIFVSDGTMNASQIDPSYDGSPARFIAEGGAIAQQAFASAEPYQYLNVFEEWGKEVKYQLIHDAGLEMYSQAFAIRTGDKAALDGCLQRLVPIVQQATIDYALNPDRANAIIVDAVATIDSFWVYSSELAAFSAAEQLRIGLVGNGPDSIVGNFEMARVQGVIDQMDAAGMDVPAGLVAADIVTNEYIDDSIGF